VWPAVLLAFEIEAGDSLEDLQPGIRVAADLDLRFNRSKRVERLIEQITHNAGLWLIARRADITNGQVVIHAQVALDETGDLPVLARPVIALQDENVAAGGTAAVAFAAALVVGMGQG
jgi:hypothetical protein